MGKVIFKNANKQEQPAEGVYRWLYRKQSQRRTLYVGQAGARGRGIVIHPSTLGRGMSELQRAAGLSSDNRAKLDTDFVIGTAIRYLRNRGFDCVWEHLSNDPHEERDLCSRHQPVLQDGNGRIRKELKLSPSDGTHWNSKDETHVGEAEKRLYRLFDRVFPK
ncbi:MAG: hypothetical protein JW993_00105 [Sedimentisphaerales bacterium]|nr:hypothetical protein [Sedimentisphaerales bacterium]